MADEKLVLKAGVIAPFLKNIQMSQDGENFFFTDLDMSGKNIDALNKFIEEAKEALNVNLSTNNIPDPTFLKELPNIIHLDLSHNKVKNITAFTNEELFVNLKYLDLKSNKFTELPAFKLPKLEYLDISDNKLEKVNEAWTGHPSLKIFKSIDNKFKTMAPFKAMPKLKELYLQNNAISSLLGCEGLDSLEKLNVRHNKIEKIEEEGFDGLLPSLKYLNLRTNKLPMMDDVYRLLNLPSLVDLNVINNPCELSFSSMNVMICHVLSKNPNPKIERFCKVAITDKNRLEAVFYGDYAW